MVSTTNRSTTTLGIPITCAHHHGILSHHSLSTTHVHHPIISSRHHIIITSSHHHHIISSHPHHHITSSHHHHIISSHPHHHITSSHHHHLRTSSSHHIITDLFFSTYMSIHVCTYILVYTRMHICVYTCPYTYAHETFSLAAARVGVHVSSLNLPEWFYRVYRLYMYTARRGEEVAWRTQGQSICTADQIGFE